MEVVEAEADIKVAKSTTQFLQISVFEQVTNQSTTLLYRQTVVCDGLEIYALLNPEVHCASE
jgi:hypothetical protein